MAPQRAKDDTPELDVEVHEGHTYIQVKGSHLAAAVSALLGLVTLLAGTWLGTYVDGRIRSYDGPSVIQAELEREQGALRTRVTALEMTLHPLQAADLPARMRRIERNQYKTIVYLGIVAKALKVELPQDAGEDD